MKDILKMAVVLTLICLVSGFALSSVYDLTAPIIKETEFQALMKPAVDAVLPKDKFAYDNDPVAERKDLQVPGQEEPITVFVAKKGGQPVGVAFATTQYGYQSPIKVMTAFDLANKQISSISIVSQSETPGRGDRIQEEAYLKPYQGKPIAGLKLGDIHAISGATVSSTAAMDAVNKAVEIFQQQQDKLLN